MAATTNSIYTPQFARNDPFFINKRKRDQMESFRSSHSNSSEGKRVHALKNLKSSLNFLPSNEELTFTILFESGDVFVVHNDQHIFIRDFIKRNDSFTWKIPISSYNTLKTQSLQFYAKVGEDNAREILVYSKNGQILLFIIEGDNRIISSECEVMMQDEDEVITACTYSGVVFAVSTSYGNVYVIRRRGRVLEAVKLQRHRNLLFGLVETGVKMLGLGAIPRQLTEGIPMNRLIPIIQTSRKEGNRRNDFLLNVTSDSISLWCNWIEGGGGGGGGTGNEKLLWTHPLHELLQSARSESDLVERDTNDVFRVLDVLVLPRNSEESPVTEVLLLSTRTRQHHSHSHPQELYLHTIELYLGSSVSSSTTTTTYQERELLSTVVQVTKCLCVSRTVSILNDNNNAMVQQLLPSLHGVVSSSSSSSSCGIGHTASWLVFASWIASDSNTLLVGQYDVRALPPVNVSSGAVALSPSPSPLVPGMDTCIPRDAVLSRSTVMGIDGLAVALRDGQVLVVLPPLSRLPRTTHTNTQTPSQTPIMPSVSSVTVTTDRADCIALLLRVVATRCREQKTTTSTSDDNDTLVVLRATFSPLSTSRLVEIVTAAAVSIADGSPRPLGGGGGSTNTIADTPRFVLCQTALSEKAKALAVMAEVLRLVDVWDESDVTAALGTVQQRVLGCVALCSAIQDAQQRCSHTPATTTATAMSMSTSTPLSTDALTNVWSLSIELVCEAMLKVVQGRNMTGIGTGQLSVVEGDGALGVLDAFFTTTSGVAQGLSAIAQSLLQYESRVCVRGRGHGHLLLLPAISQIIVSLLLVTLQAAQEAARTTPSRSLRCQMETRHGVITVLQILQRTGQYSQTPVSSSVGMEVGTLAMAVGMGMGTTNGLRRDKDSLKIADLCAILLEGFLDESSEMSGGRDAFGKDMDTNWKQTFQTAKGHAIDLLLSLGLFAQAFALSASTLYPRGLLEASNKDPLLRGQLLLVLSERGGMQGTLSSPLATECFLLLEAGGRSSELLEIGKASPEELALFVESRPSLSWLYHLGRKAFGSAATSAFLHGNAVSTARTAKTLYSIASLCAFVSEQDEQEQVGGGGGGVGVTVREGELRPEVVRGIDCGLALLRAQEYVAAIRPEAMSANQRVGMADMIPLLIDLAGAGVNGQGDALEVEEKTRLFGAALSLLSEAFDSVILLRSAARNSGDPYVLTMQQQQRDVSVTEEWVVSQKTRLWTTVLGIERQFWLDLAADAVTGPEDLYRDSLLFLVLSINMPEARAGRLRPNVLLDAADSVFLERVVEQGLGVGVQKRVLYIIASCVDEVDRAVGVGSENHS